MNEDLKKEQYELEGRSELLTEADEKFSCSGKNGFAKLAKWFCIAFKV